MKSEDNSALYTQQHTQCLKRHPAALESRSYSTWFVCDHLIKILLQKSLAIFKLHIVMKLYYNNLKKAVMSIMKFVLLTEKP